MYSVYQLLTGHDDVYWNRLTKHYKKNHKFVKTVDLGNHLIF